MTSLLEAEAALYADEGQSSFSIGEPVHNPPEADDGIPTRCFCGITEEVSEVQRELRRLKEQGFECDQKLLKLLDRL
ncbi:unnamed protein product [Brassica rapa]|uniref:Uncharacterized protein n=2 Tax=Brassica campestris TaxID=3711 RepID=A0A8D9GR26_BRACM|nr:unnamed protein product [Brassica rapa]